MPNKAMTFGNIQLIDDGTELIIKAGSNEMIKFDKSTGEITNPVSINEAKINELKLNTSGTKAVAGRATLGVSNRVTVSTAAVTSESIIIVTPYNNTPNGMLFVYELNPNTSFTIRSSGSDEGLEVNWLLINPIT